MKAIALIIYFAILTHYGHLGFVHYTFKRIRGIIILSCVLLSVSITSPGIYCFLSEVFSETVGPIFEEEPFVIEPPKFKKDFLATDSTPSEDPKPITKTEVRAGLVLFSTVIILVLIGILIEAGPITGPIIF
jgi:hypothetical protein